MEHAFLHSAAAFMGFGSEELEECSQDILFKKCNDQDQKPAQQNGNDDVFGERHENVCLAAYFEVFNFVFGQLEKGLILFFILECGSGDPMIAF